MSVHRAIISSDVTPFHSHLAPAGCLLRTDHRLLYPGRNTPHFHSSRLHSHSLGCGFVPSRCSHCSHWFHRSHYCHSRCCCCCWLLWDSPVELPYSPLSSWNLEPVLPNSEEQKSMLCQSNVAEDGGHCFKSDFTFRTFSSLPILSSLVSPMGFDYGNKRNNVS